MHVVQVDATQATHDLDVARAALGTKVATNSANKWDLDVRSTPLQDSGPNTPLLSTHAQASKHAVSLQEYKRRFQLQHPAHLDSANGLLPFLPHVLLIKQFI